MLTIANFEANYHLPQGTPDRMAVKERLDGVAAQLPVVLKDHLHSPPAEETAVYRIRHIQLDLWLDSAGMTDSEMAQHWGRLLLHAIIQVLLYGGSDEVVRYNDHAHYLAAFLGDLLDGSAWSRWMYAEFSPLRGLPVGAVAAQLLAPRPELLVPVAEHLHRSQLLERLLQELSPADAALIWQRGLGFGPPEVGWHPPEDLLLAVLQIAGTNAALETTASGWHRNLLRLYLSIVLTRRDLAGNPAVAGIIHHLVRLHQLWQKRPSPPVWAAMAKQEIDSPVALEAVLAGLDGELSAARDWLRAALTTSAGRLYLARLIPVVIPTFADEAGPDRQSAAARDWLQKILATPAGRADLARWLRPITATDAENDLRPEGMSASSARLDSDLPDPAGLARWLRAVMSADAANDHTLETLSASAGRDRLRKILATAKGRAELARLLRTIVSTDAASDPGSESLSAPSAGLEDEVPAALTGHEDLARLLRTVISSGSADSPEPAIALAAPLRLATSFAGLAFLLPVMRDLRLYQFLDAAGRYQVLLTALGNELQPLAWSDTTVSWLAGLAPQEEEQARRAQVDWPDITQWAVSVGSRELAAQIPADLKSQPCSAVTFLVLRRFAAGLRGFAESSPGYLARQFINQPGQIHIDPESIHVYLSRAPLGVVLRVAGRDGEQGRIPWLADRMLVIHLP